MSSRRIGNALISVFDKEGLEPILKKLKSYHVKIFSTGGTRQFMESEGYKVEAIEDLTSYPSILGGRVKTLHPKVFGGILARRDNVTDRMEMENYAMPWFDLVIVDLYPFEETLKSGAAHQGIIEKIDIGGISLIRAAAKNYQDVLVVPAKSHYAELLEILNRGDYSLEDERRRLSARAFALSSQYDQTIGNYLSGTSKTPLRYGENPHQKGSFIGNLEALFTQLSGKELSYNNLLDIDATLNYLQGMQEPTISIVKHNNTCGMAKAATMADAWRKALTADAQSAFGGIIGCSQPVDLEVAELINEIFFEVIIAPNFSTEALALLSAKKNRIILKSNSFTPKSMERRTLLNGVLEQEKDLYVETAEDLQLVTKKGITDEIRKDLLFANRLVKTTRSNAIVIVRNEQLLGIGCGMTSRVDALKHAIEKSQQAGLSLEGAVMASDAFFPFPDCVQIAHEHGIVSVIQPGGSMRDKDSVEYCDSNDMSMVITGKRHFKH